MKNLIISYILQLLAFLIKIIQNKPELFMKKNNVLFFTAILLMLTPLSAGPLVDLLSELNALTEFNAKARSALYKTVANAFTGNTSSPEPEDTRSAAEKVQENLNQTFTLPI